MTYEVKKFAIPYKVVATQPINETMQYIEDALNEINNKADKVFEKIDLTEKGQPLGVATLDVQGVVPDTQIKKGEANGVASLDESGIIEANQLPSNIYTNMFEVNNLEEMLALDANTGDMCKRLDIMGTFVLKNDDPTNVNNWIEISVQGQYIPMYINGIQPFKANFISTDWESYNGKYRLVYLAEEHSLGNKQSLGVIVQTANGNCVRTDYNISAVGTVTITSDVVFDGSVIITDFKGNNSIANKSAYCINQAQYDLNGNPVALVKSNISEISLNTTVPVVLIDGFNNLQSITTPVSIDVSTYLDGFYEIFYDSATETDSSKLTLILSTQYFGVVKTLPTQLQEHFRCYVEHGQSWIVENGEWVLKPFTHIGSVLIQDGKVEKLLVKPYNQNEVNTTNRSHDKDYLACDTLKNVFIKRSDNLENNVSSNGAEITIDKCLSEDKKRILEPNATNLLIKDLEYIGGVLPVEYVNVFAVGDDYGNDELVLSTSFEPNFSSIYKTHYKRIITIPYFDGKADTDITMCNGQVNFGKRVLSKFKVTASEIELPEIFASIKNIDIIYYCKPSVDTVVEVKGEIINSNMSYAMNTLYYGYGKAFTFTASNRYNKLTFVPDDSNVNFEIGILGYKEN